MEESIFDPSFGGSLPDTEEMRNFMAQESVFDPTYGGSLPTTDEMFDFYRGDTDYGAYDVTSPENYPVSLQNLQGYVLPNSVENYLSQFGSGVKNLLTSLQGKPTAPGGKQGTDYLKFILALLAARQAIKDRPRTITTGGGTTQAYQGPKSLGRTITVGPNGQPVVSYGRGMATGGPVKMEDGGFVMTKRAVDGAGGPQGIQAMLPDARMLRGPGTGTSDSIPAYIQGPNGRTPARVSNGEAYVPPGRDTKGLYALMKSLERKAR